MNEKNLAIYLNDHLAGAIAGTELAKRSAQSNLGTEWGDFLESLVTEIEQDRAELTRLMEALGIKKDLLKDAAAWVGEKVGRLKLNGQLVGYSDLSRLIELEGLALGIHGKLSLWKNLEQLELPEVKSAGLDLEDLAARAQKQRDDLEDFRLRAAAKALD
jgi:hypothetical protein